MGIEVQFSEQNLSIPIPADDTVPKRYRKTSSDIQIPGKITEGTEGRIALYGEDYTLTYTGKIDSQQFPNKLI